METIVALCSYPLGLYLRKCKRKDKKQYSMGGIMEKKDARVEKVNVLLVEIVNRNLGDMVIADNTLSVLKQSFPVSKEKQYNVYPYNIYSQDLELIRQADVIIFAGGGLIKFQQERFHEYVPEILEVAEENSIPVYFHCVGVEGYEEDDERCQRLKQTLNLSCVKSITVRDDIDTLLQSYIENSDIRIKKAIDTAVFCPEVYKKRRDVSSKVIGLGVVRPEIFSDYGTEGIDRAFQLNMWKGLTEAIENAGFEWQLFTNGLDLDYEFALEVLEECGKVEQKEQYMAKQPAKAEELIDIISGYAGMVAGRMHSNIIAYSLKIPSIALVWNNKLVFWGQRIGYPERFLSWQDMEVSKIMEALLLSIKQGVRIKIKERWLKYTSKRELARFIKVYGEQRKIEIENSATKGFWKKKLVCTELGGAQLRYKGLNHIGTMNEKYAQGFRKFEANIRLTKDGRLVCVNRWIERTYKKLGLSSELYVDEPPAYEEFKKSKYYDLYETADFEELIAAMEKKKNFTIILDIGKPKKADLEQIINELNRILRDKSELRKWIIIRLQSKYDVSRFKEEEVAYRLAYHVPTAQIREKQKITLQSIAKFCEKNEINLVTMPKEAFSEEVVSVMHKYKIRVCVFTYNTYSEIKEVILTGADLVGTHYMDVKMLEELVKEELVKNDQIVEMG